MTPQLLFSLVQSELALIEQELASAVHSQVELVTDIGNHLLRAGGKRLRPALYMLCAKSAKTDVAHTLPVAVAIELIHMATLVHDDIIDEASTRRGLATANARWGNKTAVLSGDYLFAKAFSLVANHADNSVLKALTDAICVICEGEIVQARNLFHVTQTQEEYLSRIGQKTAEFIAVSCELGAKAAGLSDGDVKSLRCFGYSVGMAFQLTDDILDFTGSMAQFGKPVGNDLRQGVLTMPVLCALESSPYCTELADLIKGQNMTEANLARCLSIIRETDAIEYSYQKVSEYLELARQSLPESVRGEVRSALNGIADFIGLRNF